ncbi:MAG TPA: hypothetical protein VGK56_15200 [Anaerolineales bacterium]
MLYPKPSAISRIGMVQFFLASAFVLWLLFFPHTGTNFAWPITPVESARFIGASFLLRAFFGWHLWQQKDWLYLRWSRWGNFAFLAILFLATFWHIDQMNWQSNIVVAHIWVLAYTAEPLVLWLVEPRAAESEASVPASLSEGPVLPGLKNLFMFMFVVGMGLGAVLFMHPAFADTRWAWPLTEFDSRVMAAWPVAIGVFSATMYFAEDWAEIKVGVQTVLVYVISIFVLWLFTFRTFDSARHNVYTIGIAPAILIVLLGYYYWRQAYAPRKLMAGEGQSV